jgi:hypothetical protein
LLSNETKGKTCRTIILPAVLYGCQTLFLTVREAHKLRVFKNSVLKKFRPRRNKVTEEWRKLHNEELKDPHPSPHIVKVITSKRMR